MRLLTQEVVVWPLILLLGWMLCAAEVLFAEDTAAEPAAKETGPKFDIIPPAVPPGAHIRLSPLKERWLLGENILLHYEVRNDGDQPFSVDVGGDYRGGTRADRFQVHAIHADGTAQEDPQPDQIRMGGMGGSFEVKPGESWYSSIPLMRYRTLANPGRYTIRVAHDLGWQGGLPGQAKPAEEDEDDPRWAETEIEVAMPSDAEARQVVAEMQAMKNPGGSWGKKREPYPDFTCLRYPVYLPVLMELARQHHLEAIAGISGIATPEATTALVELLSLPDNRSLRNENNAARKRRGSFYVQENVTISDAAAQALLLRVPDPEILAGERTHYMMRGKNYLEVRKKLIKAAWRPEHAAPVRAYVKAILKLPPLGLRNDRYENAVRLLQMIATEEDHAAIINALDQSLVWSKKHDPESPLEYGVLYWLKRCVEALKIPRPTIHAQPERLEPFCMAATGGKHAIIRR